MSTRFELLPLDFLLLPIFILSLRVMPTVHLLDYVAGNIRSLVNAINQVGYEVEWVKTPEDVKNADVSHLSCAKILRSYNPMITSWD